MRIQAKVVNQFQAIEHENHIYEPGHIYPAEGFEADPERVTFLSKVHPEYKKIYLAEIEEINDSDEADFPKHVGKGFYELSNGEKVKGKEEATKAEEALHEQE